MSQRQNCSETDSGLGQKGARILVYIGNRPPLAGFSDPQGIKGLVPGDIEQLVAAGGNHWRKIFVIYAKLLQRLQYPHLSWQACRQNLLLQQGSGVALVFSHRFLPDGDQKGIHIISGKAHASALMTPEELMSLERIDDFFAFDERHQRVVAPYFDYRQLSDRRIDQLVSIVSKWI